MLSALTSGPGLRRVIIAYGLYGLVEFSIWIAILLYAYGIGGASLAGIAGVVQLVPAIVVVPVLAGIGDRMPRGQALMAAHAFVAVSTVITGTLLVISAPSGVVIAGSAVCTTAVALVRPLHFAALPQLAVRPADLVSANALSSALDGVGLFVGPVLAGIVAQFAGPWLVFGIAAVLSTAATLLCLRLNLAAPPAQELDAVSDLRAAMAGLVTLWRDWGSLALLLVMGAKFVLDGALEVLGVSFSEDVLAAGPSAAGFVIGAIGLGGLAGASLGARASNGRRLAPVVLAGGLVAGLGLASVAYLGAIGPVMAVLALSGMGAMLVMVSGRTLLQRATEDRVLARVFAVQEGTSLLGLALGAALAPLLIDWISPAGAFIPLGLGMMLLTAGSYWFVRRLDARAVFLPVEVALLRGVPFLSGLPPFEIERLAARASWRDVDADEVIVRAGDTGSDYFVIGAGSVTVSVGAGGRTRSLHSGVGFGEIALLDDVPRTATVTADAVGRLLVVCRNDFLAAVTGSPDGLSIAAEVSAAHRARDASTLRRGRPEAP